MTDVIISHGACLASTTRAAIETAQRTGRVCGVQWGMIRWSVAPSDTVAVGVRRFHAAAALLRRMENPHP